MAQQKIPPMVLIMLMLGSQHLMLMKVLGEANVSGLSQNVFSNLKPTCHPLHTHATALLLSNLNAVKKKSK
ncbi:hypothetical protein CCACVL1_03044, partial [Corchorus capsularis]